MKVIVTGSLGHISRTLSQELIQKGHTVTVVSSKPSRQQEIKALGATAAIGSLEDLTFLASTFSRAGAVYTMVPPNNYFDHSLDLLAYYEQLGVNYAEAIKRSGVQRVVNLSTFGAHLEKGNGLLVGAHKVEKILNSLPAAVSITHIRPTSFYYNLLGYIHSIKTKGIIVANYGTGNTIPWVSPNDIATAIAEELETPMTGRKIRYVVSEELTGSETAAILGAAIGKPDLKWDVITNEEQLVGLVAAGMNPQIAAGLVELYAALQSGLLSEDYIKNRPAVTGKVKLKDYATQFAAAYNA